LNEYGINLKRIAITREQIQKFGLQYLTNPDLEVLSKLNRHNADISRRNNDGRIGSYNEVMNGPNLSLVYIRGLLNNKVMVRFGNS
jgi:hypothetical protein